MSLQWRREVSHASVLLRVRCGQDSLLACRLASSRCVHAATSLHWAHAIIARVHIRLCRRMLETLVVLEKYVVHNGHVYKALPGHHRHTKELLMYPVDSPWELCPNTSDALRVCAVHHWFANALVFADGSAHWTRVFEHMEDGFGLQPGFEADQGCLNHFEGKYHVCNEFLLTCPSEARSMDLIGGPYGFVLDILVRCHLPN
jgi:hypothetical protein